MQDDKTTVAELKQVMEQFVAERDWQPFHDPKNLSMSIAIEAAELMEHVQWMRSEELVELRHDPVRLGEMAEELADIFAYVLSFAATMEIDLSAALRGKMIKNAQKYPVEQFKGKYK